MAMSVRVKLKSMLIDMEISNLKADHTIPWAYVLGYIKRQRSNLSMGMHASIPFAVSCGYE